MRRGTKTEPVCNKDCFHCPYPDCVADDTMDLEDYREARERDLDIRRTPEQKKIAAKKKAYREANREEIAAKQKAYREANREEIAAKQSIISRVRRSAGISQQVLSEALGISRQLISHFECGRVYADVPAVLARIAELAHMSVETLMEEAGA